MNKNYVVSDLHGMLSLWNSIQNYCDETDTIYVLGDATDRGPDSWATLKSILADPRVKYIKGNHDQMLLDAWQDDWRDVWVWYNNGGSVTHEQLLQDPQHDAYLCELQRQPYKRLYTRADGTRIHLTHAGFTPLQDVFYPSNHDLVWDREHWLDKCEWWDEENPNDWVVCGHTPIISSTMKRASREVDMSVNENYTVLYSGHKICIDAGCFASGKIALLDLDTFDEIIFEIEDFIK